MMQYTDTEAALIGGLISNYFFQPAVGAGAFASECAHVLRPSADPKGCEFSDAHVPDQPPDAAGADGRQYEDNCAAEHGALRILYASGQRKTRLAAALFFALFLI